MNENVENRILARLPETAGEAYATGRQSGRDFAQVRADTRERTTDDVALILTMLAGRVRAIDGRVEPLEAMLA